MKVLLAIIVMLNGKPVEFKEAKPVIQGNIVMVPLRDVSQGLKTTFRYIPHLKFVSVRFRQGPTERVLTMQLGSRSASVSKWYAKRFLLSARYIAPSKPTRILLDAPPQLKNGRIYVPLRFAEIFGNAVVWDKAKKTARIYKLPAPKQPTKKLPAPAIKSGKIEASITSDKSSYRAGEPVKLTITTINQDAQPRALHFLSERSFDVRISLKGKGKPIWHWSHGQKFTQGFRRKILKPGEKLTFEAIWGQQDNDGEAMPRGEYSVEAGLASEQSVAAFPSPLTIMLTE